MEQFFLLNSSSSSPGRPLRVETSFTLRWQEGNTPGRNKFYPALARETAPGRNQFYPALARETAPGRNKFYPTLSRGDRSG